MKWKQPPIIKIYEALGAVADERVKTEVDRAEVFSSSGNKSYEVYYDKKAGSIMSNDNGSYWKGYLGYPAIAYLMKVGEISYRADLGSLLKGIHWKNINQKFRNDFGKTLEHIEKNLSLSDRVGLRDYVTLVEKEIEKLNLKLLGEKILPPEGY